MVLEVMFSKDVEAQPVKLGKYTGHRNQKWNIVYLDGMEEKFNLSTESTDGKCQKTASKCIR